PAWQNPRESRPVAFEGWRVLAATSVFSLSAVALLVADHGDTLNIPALVLATATVLGAFVRTAVSFREIRQLADSRRQAMTDDLTGLANRRALARAAELAIAQAAEDGASVTLVMADLERFKELNDALGHDVGDELLERVGPRIADRVPHHELVARVGGDEFAVLLPRGAGPSEGLDAAAAVRGALGRPFQLT